MTNALFRQLDLYASVHRDGRNRATRSAGPAPGRRSPALFIGGWALQFLGHHYEGKRPALMDTIFQAFIGPMFLWRRR